MMNKKKLFMVFLIAIILVSCGNKSKTVTYVSPGGFYSLNIPKNFTPKKVPSTQPPNSEIKIVENSLFVVPENMYTFSIIVAENTNHIDTQQYATFSRSFWNNLGIKIQQEEIKQLNGKNWYTMVITHPNGKWGLNVNHVKQDVVISLAWLTSSKADFDKYSPQFQKILETVLVK